MFVEGPIADDDVSQSPEPTDGDARRLRCEEAYVRHGFLKQPFIVVRAESAGGASIALRLPRETTHQRIEV